MSVVQPQPVPLSWRWEQVPGQIQRVPDQPPETVVLIRLIVHHPAGVFVGHFIPDDLDKLADQAKDEARKSRTGIETFTRIPPGIVPPNGQPG